MSNLLTRFVRSRTGVVFLTYLAFAGAISAGVAYGFYNSSLEKFRAQKAEEKTTALRLVDAFVTNYSSVRLQLGPNAPVPATFRAHSIEKFNQQTGSNGEFILRWVGRQGRQITTPPADFEMARTIEAFAALSDSKPQSMLSDIDGRLTLRTIYASLAREQGCVNCHNQLQPDKPQWRLNDVMGAFAIDIPVAPFLQGIRAQSYLIGLSLFLALAAMGLAISILNFRQTNEREAAAMEVRTQNLRFDAALKNMTHGLAMFDHNERLVLCNERFAQMYRLTPDMTTPGTTSQQLTEYRIANGGYYVGVTAEDHRRQGARTWARRIRQLTDGRVVALWRQPMPGGGWVTTHEDITEQQHYDELKKAYAAATTAEAEARLAVAAAEEASRAKSTFLANMSHEIRTPMNGVFGMTDLLMRTELTERQQRLVSTINQSAKSLLTIINDILDVSRIEAGKLVLDRNEFDLRQSIEDTVDLLAETAQKKGLELTLRIAPEVPSHVIGDGGRVRQVCTNIISNAVKFTQVGEIGVTVSCSESADGVAKVEFKIRDSGIGIPADVQHRLFQPFAQADTSISRRFGGTGLGLAITKHLVEMMDGEIKLVSEPGVGSEFTFRLPLTIGVTAPSLRDEAATSLAGVRILVLDDRANNREIIASYLDESGAVTTCVETPEAALRALREAQSASCPFALAIIDMVLPGSSGLEVADMIKAEPAIASVRLVMVTSLSWKADMQTARDHGFRAFLTKPVHRKELIDTATAALAREERTEPVNAGLRHQTAKQQQVHNYAARVLVAEDNPVNVDVVREYLGNLGCAITLAGSGVEAVAAFSEPRFDIILMDCQMPEMDGLAATRLIRETEKVFGMTRTPIVAVTANAYAEDRARCLAAGMDDYLSKPFTEAQLEQLLSKWSKLSASEAGTGLDDPTNKGAVIAASERTKPNNSNSNSEGAGGRPLKERAAAPSTPTAPEEPTEPLDQQTLVRFCEAYPALFDRLLETYAAHLPHQTTQMQQAMHDGDMEAIRAIVHSLKSSSANVGALRLAAHCRDLEVKIKSCAAGNHEPIGPLVQNFAAEAAAVLGAIVSARHKLASNGSGKQNVG